ncbi:hypothetical protein WS73_29465 [Burkholderia savannae]|uniref:hypothetical protein n=1 Tax=Burkholderia savannae TaxID=1637837 RepID=UPI000763BAB5|nr:hypothetical protein [Burkholderia savannae]KWZ39722.1 hypothetical protein WS73_29465 [Burkholderia savannae]
MLGDQALAYGGYACPLDGDMLSSVGQALTLDEYVSPGHVLVSPGGVVGIVDEALAALGLKRNVIAPTAHFAALPFLLKGSRTFATIPAHAAAAIAAMTGLRLVASPVSLS